MSSERKLKRIVRANLVISFLGILFFGFQNCSEVQFNDDFTIATFENENSQISSTQDLKSSRVKEVLIK
jgi:hypothetical protein